MTTLISTIKQDQVAARKNKDTVRASLLTTLYAEAAMIGKNAGDRETTNDEVIKVIQKFLKGVNETMDLFKGNPESERYLHAAQEKVILESYLPKMASEDEVRAEIATLKAAGASNIGAIMKGLRDKFGSTLDGKMASQLAKE